MKFNASLPEISEIRVVGVGFEENAATVIVRALSESGETLREVALSITNDKSNAISFVPGATDFEKTLPVKVIESPGMLRLVWNDFSSNTEPAGALSSMEQFLCANGLIPSGASGASK